MKISTYIRIEKDENRNRAQHIQKTLLFRQIKTTAQSSLTVHSVRTEQTLSPLLQMNVNIEGTKKRRVKLTLQLTHTNIGNNNIERTREIPRGREERGEENEGKIVFMPSHKCFSFNPLKGIIYIYIYPINSESSGQTLCVFVCEKIKIIIYSIK